MLEEIKEVINLNNINITDIDLSKEFIEVEINHSTYWIRYNKDLNFIGITKRGSTLPSGMKYHWVLYNISTFESWILNSKEKY